MRQGRNPWPHCGRTAVRVQRAQRLPAARQHHPVLPIAQEFQTMPFDRRWPLACLFAAVPGICFAQATVKRDGEYRYAFSAGTSYASGNTDASSITLSGDGVRATEGDKWQFGG